METAEARFEGLYRRHYGAVVRYCVRRVGPDAAAEVVSETFLVAWRRFADVPDDPLPWLLGTARRVVANELRRRAREGQLLARIRDHGAVTTGDHAGAVAERDAVLAALDRLSPRDREVLQLVLWDDLDHATAARVLGCGTAAYKVRLHRARRRLGRLLDASVRDGSEPADGLVTWRGELT
jgi:RNA polymerase sigma-70 factor (ECF subfamily)